MAQEVSPNPVTPADPQCGESATLRLRSNGPTANYGLSIFIRSDVTCANDTRTVARRRAMAEEALQGVGRGWYRYRKWQTAWTPDLCAPDFFTQRIQQPNSVWFGWPRHLDVFDRAGEGPGGLQKYHQL